MPRKQAFSPEMEGQFAVPMEQMISALCDLLSCKYAIEMAYRSFSDRVRGPWRDGLVEHWQEHAKDERQGSYDLAMKIIGLGGDPNICHIGYDPSGPDVTAFCHTLAKMELDMIAKAQKVVDYSGDNTALRVMAENIMELDTHHLDDLRRMCPEMPL